MRPTFDRVLIKLSDPETTTPGGLIVPPAGEDRPDTGVVQAVGHLVTTVGEGDFVYFGRHAGVEIDHDGAPHVIMSERDILACSS